MGRLREWGAIEVATRGPLGAFIVGGSIGRLWEAAGGGPLVIAVPLGVAALLDVRIKDRLAGRASTPPAVP